jgi:hypothetical protein
MKKWILISLLVCSTLCYAQADDPFGLYKGSSKSRKEKIDLGNEYGEREKIMPFVGLNVGLGGDFGKGFGTFEGSIGVDVAASINDRFALGGYLSYQTISSVSLGVLFVHGNYNNDAAFLWGIGYSTPEFYNLTSKSGYELRWDIKCSPNVRVGYKLKSGLYFMADMEVSDKTFRKDVREFDKYSFDANIRVGWKFNLEKKK